MAVCTMLVVLLLAICVGLTPVWAGANMLQNAGFESLDHWECPHFTCTLSSTAVSGLHAIHATHRDDAGEGPQQQIHVIPGHTYHVSAYVKLLKQSNTNGEYVQIKFNHRMTNGTMRFTRVTFQDNVGVSDGWIKLIGTFQVPKDIHIEWAVFQVRGGGAGVEYLVDDVTLRDIIVAPSEDWRNATDSVINKLRKSNIHVQVTNHHHLHLPDVSVQILQTKKSFPWGMAVKAPDYNKNAAHGKYRDFIHKHFNWAAIANALKWHTAERVQGQKDYRPGLETLHGLRKHGLKVRGMNLVWSRENAVQSWVKAMSGDTLRQAVRHHIQEVMNLTHGMLEHWDVNNENLRGKWYQERLHDPDYDLELFRIAHQTDPTVKLFLNDGVMNGNEYTQKYLDQALKIKAGNVGLYGMGVQCHFHGPPSPYGIKDRFDVLAKAGIPIWVTELDVGNMDEDVRADQLEIAIRSFYGHPAVEGIVFWGFWDKNFRRQEAGAWVKGDNFEMTAAGRRVLDLLENQFMTDETHRLTHSPHFTVRGFHGDYEVHVHYRGQELHNATHTFTLGKQDRTLHIVL